MAYIYDLTDTWNAGGTTFNAIKMNVTDSASAAASKLITLQTNGTEHFSVTKAGVGYFSGNVGIGTSSPGAKLTIYDTANAQVFVQGTTSYAQFHANNTSGSFHIGIDNSTGTGFGAGAYGRFLYSGGAYPMVFFTNGTERMRIDGSGLVGIGTSSPGYRLDIPATGTVAGNMGGILIGANGTDIVGSVGPLSLQATGANYVGFNTNSSERMRITSAGNVGIGTTGPAEKLSVVGNIELAVGADRYVKIGSSTNYIYTLSAVGDDFQILEAGTTPRLTIKYPNGNVGIGTTNPNTRLHAAGSLTVNDRVFLQRASSNLFLSIASYWNGSGSALNGTKGDILAIGNSGGDGLVFVNSDTERMRIDSSGNVGIGTSSPGAKLDVLGASSDQIRVRTSGTEFYRFGRNSSTGYMDFYGSQTGYTGYTFGGVDGERARIDTSGNLLVGTTSNSLSTRVFVSGAIGARINSENANRPLQLWNEAATGQRMAVFLTGSGATVAGSIECASTTTSYLTSSDARLKKNIAPADESAALIDAIQVRKFDWKETGNHQRYGFIAQELLEVAPEAVSQPANPEEMMGVDYSKLVPMLVKEIQSLRARVAQLEGN